MNIEKIVNKLYLKDKLSLVAEIEKKYQENNYVIIDFIYYASLSKYIINENKQDYIDALLNSDFLLPDGIALKLYLKYKWKKIMQENLNGTDFTPYFINYLQQKGYKIHLAYYTVYDEKIGKEKEDFEKVQKYLEDNFKLQKIKGFISHYSKRGDDFSFKDYENDLNENYDIRLFLVGIGSPFQEIWVEQNKDFFKKNKILVMNVGGLFDFWTNFEKRAPKIILKMNLEWLWRLGQNPKKNWTKVKESLSLFKEIFKK